MATEFNLKRLNRDKLTTHPIYTSMVTLQYQNAFHSDHYLPVENHFQPDPLSKFKEDHPFKELRNNRSCTNLNFKHHFDAKPKNGKETQVKERWPISTKNLYQFKKKDSLLTTLKNIDYKTPKLRQTNSTLCQSPKANSVLQQSKISDFKNIKLLGQGKFGDVFLVRHKKTGFIGAIKVIRKIDLFSGTPEQNQKSMEQVVSQIKIQSFADHPNLIKLYSCFSDERNVYLLLQLACDGHLFDLLQTNHSFSEESTSIMVREIVSGVDYLHQKNIIHRDIKLENIVLSHGMAKICDFGWSVYCPKEFRTTFCGTPLYLSPEILIGHRYNKKIDTWAIGALTYQLVTSENPFNIKQKSDISKIVTEDFEMKTGSPEIRSFITFILRKNPAKRPDTDTIKRHPFLEKYKDLETLEELCRPKIKKQFRKQYII